MAKILIVEDDKSINDLIAMNLSIIGYDCEKAFDGYVAVEMIKNTRYDLILLDIMLPGVSGIDLLKSNICENTKVILITAKGGLNDKLEAFNLGAYDYIVKLNSSEIFDAIRKIEFQKLKEKNIDLKINIETEYFYGDEQLILVVLTNLIDNAINASKNNTKIEVTIYSEDDKTIIKISDQGKGIGSKDFPNIFQPFYKPDKNRPAIYRGAGLGLSLCKKIVDLHNGSIEVKSQKDIGTKIHISLKSI